MQAMANSCMSCNKFFNQMPALQIENQQVNIGLHVLHEITNFFSNFGLLYVYQPPPPFRGTPPKTGGELLISYSIYRLLP